MMNFNFLAICVFMVSFSINHLHGQDLYDTDSIQEMHITFSQSNWDYLLDSLMNIGDDRLMAQSVVLNGVSFDSAGVRFKGNSSYQPNNIKNPLNVKLSYLKDQDYNGYQTFKLSSGFKDPSFAREVYAYEIARNYMPAPRANFINVYINGSLYGLFTNVEAVNKDFLENYFSSNENILFKCDGDFSGPPSQIPGCPPGHGSALEYKGQDITEMVKNNLRMNQDGFVLKREHENQTLDHPIFIKIREGYMIILRRDYVLDSGKLKN